MTWFDDCIERAMRRHRHAQYLLRSARRNPLPKEWGVEHRNVTEAREVLRDAISWIWMAKDERARSRHASAKRSEGSHERAA
jgi:hypothetical protein